MGKETAEGSGEGLGKKGKTEGARGPKGREEVMRKKSKMTHVDISCPSLALTELHSEPLTSDLFLDSTILGVVYGPVPFCKLCVTHSCWGKYRNRG